MSHTLPVIFCVSLFVCSTMSVKLCPPHFAVDIFYNNLGLWHFSMKLCPSNFVCNTLSIKLCKSVTLYLSVRLFPSHIVCQTFSFTLFLVNLVDMVVMKDMVVVIVKIVKWEWECLELRQQLDKTSLSYLARD